MYKRIACSVCVAAMIGLSACSQVGSLESAMDVGASQFAEGKDIVQYSPPNTGTALKALLDEYTGSYYVPGCRKLIDEEFLLLKEQMDSELGETDIPVITSDTDLLRLFHDAYDANATEVRFIAENGVAIDGDKLDYIYKTLIRDDPIDVCLVKSWVWGGVNNEYIVNIDYLLPESQLISVKNDTKTLVKKVVSEMDTVGKSNYDIICQVNELICSEVCLSDSVDDAYSHVAYGVICDKTAACDGYSCLTKLILNELGIECDIVFGESVDGDEHVWNLVKVDNDWYHLDVTWNDGANKRTHYLLVSDEYMQKSRSWDTNEYAQSASENYSK